MTRINAGIPVKDLSDKHLIAEHREIKRIPNTINSGKANLNIPIPNEFTLGKGHVRFFYNKLMYLHNRYQEIYEECVRRGFNVTDYSEAFMINDPDHEYLIQDWVPTNKATELIRQRIIDNNEKSRAKSNKH